MEKEKVTEELVRQNGNQAAAVMADYVGQGGGGGGGGSTGSANGVVIQGGSIVNNASPRPATEVDVAKFSAGVVVGQPVFEINGVIPYVLQANDGDESAAVFLLTQLDLTEHSAYYVQNGVASSGDAHFIVMVFLISDDATLLAPYQEVVVPG